MIDQELAAAIEARGGATLLAYSPLERPRWLGSLLRLTLFVGRVTGVGTIGFGRLGGGGVLQGSAVGWTVGLLLALGLAPLFRQAERNQPE